MKKVAEIHQSRVIALHEVPDDFTVQFSPKSFRFAVDITNLDPQPQTGWGYDFNTGNFSEPVPVPQTVITSKAFVQRMTGAEREAFFSSADPKVVMVKWWLSFSGDVNLEDPDVITGANLLENRGIIGPGRAAEILTI